MSRVDRKERIREYKREPRPAGIYQVRNTANGRVLVGSSTDLPGALNRQRFQLTTGSHPDADLQADWKSLGAEAFEFSVLDTLKPRDEPSYDPRKELEILMDMWLEKLRESGVSLYGRTPR